MTNSIKKNKNYNFGFENQKEKDSLSDGWLKNGKYNFLTDTVIFKDGNKSGKISSNNKGNYGYLFYKIPGGYEGKSIKLEGYMKIKNVENGNAGLILQLTGYQGNLVFDNMHKQNIKGTKDWHKYSITLDYPKNVKEIIIGGSLTGKGEVWFDNFVLSIDNKKISELKVVEKKVPKALLDNEFKNGSLIDISNLNENNINNLELLGKVWGFLKYYHPEIAKGNYNWDYELFRFLPKYIKAKNEHVRNNLIINWIDSLGKINKCLNCNSTDSNAFLKPDLKWIDNQNEILKNRLYYIYNNRYQGKRHYYIEMAKGVGNPIFKNEHSYSNMHYLDDGYRLLSLYRYWNIINYFFPYKYLIDENWNKILNKYIPLFLKAKNELEYQTALIQVIGEIKDTHANLWTRELYDIKGANYPPFHVRFIENQLVITDYYNEELINETSLNIGDIITKINGIPVQEVVNKRVKYYPASNIPTRLRDISADILRSDSKKIQLNIISNNYKRRPKTIKLYPRDSLNVFRWFKRTNKRCYKILNNNIGYITLSTIKDEDIEKIKNDFKDTKGIIIDLRNYPSTFVPFSLGSYFVSSSTPFVKFTLGNINNPGEFNFTKSLEIPSDGKTYKGKLVVLINELTQSQAEYTTMAFRAGDNTTVIGSTTAGTDGNFSSIMLPGGIETGISGVGVYYPNGGETQRIGIIPDIEVKPTILGIKNGKDELLEKAIEVIINESNEY